MPSCVQFYDFMGPRATHPYSCAFIKDHKLVARATLVAYLLKLELETEKPNGRQRLRIGLVLRTGGLVRFGNGTRSRNGLRGHQPPNDRPYDGGVGGRQYGTSEDIETLQS